MNRTTLFCLVIACWSIHSHSLGQTYFQQLSEILHTEDVPALNLFVQNQKGAGQVIAETYNGYFNKGEHELNSMAYQTLSLSPEEKLSILWIEAYEQRHKLNYAASIKLCDSVLKVLKPNDPYVKAEFNRFIGVTYMFWGDINLSLEHLKRAELLFAESRSEIGQVVCSYNIANVYLSFGRYHDFEKHLSASLKNYKTVLNDYPYYRGNFNSLEASREFLNDNYSSAFIYTAKNVSLYTELKDSSNISRSAFNSAIAADYSNYLDSALFYLELSKAYDAGEPHPSQQLKKLISLMVFLAKEDYKDKVLDLYGFSNMDDFFQAVDTGLEETDDDKLKLNYLSQKAAYLKSNGKHTALIAALEQQNDILSNMISSDTLNSNLVHYKLELEQTRSRELEYKNTISNSEKANLEAKLVQRAYWGAAIFILIALLTVIGFLRIKHRRKTQQIIHTRKLEQLKNEKMKEELAIMRENLINFKTQLLEKTRIIDSFGDNIDLTSSERKVYYEKMNEMKILTDEDWEKFKKYFEGAHPKMKNALRESNITLTDGETRILMLYKLNFTRRQMSDILGIGTESIRKASYRLKKKLEPNQLELLLLEF